MSDLERNRRIQIKECFEERNEEKGCKEEDRRLHLDRSLPLWVLPSQIRQTEDSQADGKLRMGLVIVFLFSWWYLYDIYDQGRPMESLRLGLVDGLCFLGGIFMIFGDKGRLMES